MSTTPRNPSAAPLPEQFGRYRIQKLLGKGGMGSVYLAHDSQMHRLVALKVPRFTEDDGPEMVERFYREARIAGKLRHPNICSVYDVGEVDGTHFLTMAYIDGRPLTDFIPRDKGVPQRQAALLVRKLALALQEAHANDIIHRDLKPDNIMIDLRQEPIIMDFGLARRTGRDGNARLTQDGDIMGTPAYMSPEQAKGRLDQVGPSWDVYSLGVILYELLTGRPPYEGPSVAVLGSLLVHDPEPPSKHRPDIDPVLELICRRAMAREPAQRYARMSDLAAALTNYLQAKKEPRPEPPEWSASWVQSDTLVPSPRLSDDGSALVRVLPETTDEARPIPAKGAGGERAPVWRPRLAISGGLCLLGLLAAGAYHFLPSDGTRRGLEASGHSGLLSAPTTFTNSIGMEFVLIPAGSFAMGSPEEDKDHDADEVPHDVEISQAFYLGTHEVTRGQFQRFVAERKFVSEAERTGGGGGFDPAAKKFEARKPRYSWKDPGFPQTDEHPVVNVSWHDATAFCEWLSVTEGRTYRLPTEAEWEYSCRAGTQTRFCNGDDVAGLVRVGNVADASFAKMFPGRLAIAADDGHVFTAPVGTFEPNRFGVCDMHGNVWEWCADGYVKDYQNGSRRDPRAENDQRRLIRGGSFDNAGRGCRSADRSSRAPGDRHQFLGFRVVCERPAT